MNAQHDSKLQQYSSTISQKDIAILIPTMNRPQFLGRALAYYRTTGFDGYICIGDSSSEELVQQNIAFIRSASEDLNILYRYFPPTKFHNDSHCLKKLIDIAPARYLVYSGDDDLLVPAGLLECAIFLSQHPDYSAVHGVRAYVKLNAAGAYGAIIDSDFIFEHILENDSPHRRLAGYLLNANSTQYYVHRKETWQKMYEQVSSIELRYIGPELLPCSLSAVLGKIGLVKCLTTVFQINEERVFSWQTNSLFELMLSPEWPSAISVVRTSIMQAILMSEDVRTSDTQSEVDILLLMHFSEMLSWQYFKQYPDYLKHELPCVVDLIPFADNTFNLLFGNPWHNVIKWIKQLIIKELHLMNRVATDRLVQQAAWYNVMLLYIDASKHHNLDSYDREKHSIRSSIANSYKKLLTENRSISDQLRGIIVTAYSEKA